MVQHTFKPGEKEAVAAVLGIEPQMIPDTMELEPEVSDEDEDEEDEVIEDEDEDDDEDEASFDDDEEDDEDDEAEKTDEDVETLKLLNEWQKDYREHMLFSEFLKNRGK